MKLVGFQNSAWRIMVVWSLLFFLTGLGVFFDGVAIGEERTGDGQTVVLNKQDSGKRIDVKKGEVVQVELEAIGTAGYQWFVESFDQAILKLVFEEAKVLHPESLGSPVLMIWKFEMIKEGMTDIKMDHYRSWEGKEHSTDHFEVKINVRP